MSNADANRRDDRRAPLQEGLFLRLAASEDGSAVQGDIVRSTSNNVSANGLCVRVDRRVDPGAPLELWVKVASRPGTFLLKGEVRWCRAARTDEYELGIELQGASGDPLDDRDDWRRLLATVTTP